MEEESFGAGPPPAPLLDEEKSGEIFGIPFLVAQSTVNPYFFFLRIPSLSLIWAYLSPSLPTLAVKTSSNSFFCGYDTHTQGRPKKELLSKTNTIWQIENPQEEKRKEIGG